MRWIFAFPLFLTVLLGAAPARAAHHGSHELLVTLSPAGGVVYLDGKEEARDPGEHVRLSTMPGKHHLRVEHQGFQPFEADVEVQRSGPTELKATLVAVSSAPAKVADDSPAAIFDVPTPTHRAFISVAVELPGGSAEAGRTRRVLGDAVAAEILKLDQVARTLGPAELREIVKAKKIRPQLTCNNDESCLMNAAGIDELISGSVELAGKDATLTLRRTELATGKELKTAKREIKQASGKNLAEAVGPLVADLYPDHALLPGHTRGSAADVAARFSPPPLPRWVFWSTAGAAAATLLTGAVFEISSADARSNLHTLEVRGAGSELSPLALNSSVDQVGARNKQAIVLFSVGGGLAAAAAVEFFLTDWHCARAAGAPLPDAAPVAFRLLPTGMMLTWR